MKGYKTSVSESARTYLPSFPVSTFTLINLLYLPLEIEVVENQRKRLGNLFIKLKTNAWLT